MVRVGERVGIVRPPAVWLATAGGAAPPRLSKAAVPAAVQKGQARKWGASHATPAAGPGGDADGSHRRAAWRACRPAAPRVAAAAPPLAFGSA